CGYSQCRPIRLVDLRALPRGQSLSGGAKPLCTSVRREQARRGHSVSFAGAIEIVSMLVMAQQNSVEWSDLFRRERRPGGLFQRHMRYFIRAGGIESRIRHQAEPTRLDECCGAPN